MRNMDIRQSILRSALSIIGSAAGDSVDTILIKTESRLTSLFSGRNGHLADGGVITFSSAGTSVSFTQILRWHSNFLSVGGSPSIFNLGSTTRTVSANGRMIYALLNSSAVTATVVDDAATLPTLDSTSIATTNSVVLIAKRVDSADGKKCLVFRDGTVLEAGQSKRLGVPGFIAASEFAVHDATDTTKRMIVQASGSTASTSTTLAFAQTTNRVITFPDATTTLVGTDNSQTLTNKTLGFVRTSVSTDASTTGADATLSAFTSGVVRLSNISLTSVSGIPAGADGQQLLLENKTGTTVTLKNDDAGATAADRIFTGSGSSVLLLANSTAHLVYDATAVRWHFIGQSGAGSGTLNVLTFSNTFTPTADVATTGNTVSGVNQITNISSITGISIGMAVMGNQLDSASAATNMPILTAPNFPNGTTITNITGAGPFTLTTSHNATATGTGLRYVFTWDKFATWVVPATTTEVTVELCGGGGGGGAGGGAFNGFGASQGGGGGGGEGAPAVSVTMSVTPGSTILMSLGKGGFRGAGVSGTSGGHGEIGHNTYWDIPTSGLTQASTVTVPGGQWGNAGTTATAGVGGAGGSRLASGLSGGNGSSASPTNGGGVTPSPGSDGHIGLYAFGSSGFYKSTTTKDGNNRLPQIIGQGRGGTIGGAFPQAGAGGGGGPGGFGTGGDGGNSDSSNGTDGSPGTLGGGGGGGGGAKSAGTLAGSNGGSGGGGVIKISWVS